MRKLLRYQNGDEYISGGLAGIQPNGVEPIEVFDLTSLPREEFESLKKNLTNKKVKDNLLKKAKKLEAKK